MNRLALASALVVMVSLAGCDEEPTLVGTYSGVGSVNYDLYAGQTPDPKAPRFEPFRDVTIAAQGDDLKVTFGACSVVLKKPQHKMESAWKVVPGTLCATAHGPAKIAEGSLLNMSATGAKRASFNLSLSGPLEGDKYKVTWTFVTSASSP